MLTKYTPTHEGLVEVQALMGDRASNIVCWLMHSGAYHKLMKNDIGSVLIDSVAGAMIYGAQPGLLGKPAIVTDCSDLVNGTTSYYLFGLTAGALRVTASNAEITAGQVVLGLENISYRLQTDYEYMVGVKGVAYNYGAGGANPDDTALATTTNWTFKLASIKNGPGVYGEFDYS